MRVLGIETSCDETAAAVVDNGRSVLSNVIGAQTELHSPYGGVVPEIASRAHVEALPGIIDRAINDASTPWRSIDAVAVTCGPGLASSLLVGISAAKALAFSLGKRLIAVNHLEAHIHSVFLNGEKENSPPAFPFVALVVSGGHTALVMVKSAGKYSLLGQTVDDAAGEAFDKGASLLGLGYPGGPAIEAQSRGGDPAFVRFPRAKHKTYGQRIPQLNTDLCFSFSGVKTSLMYYLKKNEPKTVSEIKSVAASYQEAIVDALAGPSLKAARQCGRLVVAGGVSINSRLRGKIAEAAPKQGVQVFWAERGYCTDNAAMVAGLAGEGGGSKETAGGDPDVFPNLGIGTPRQAHTARLTNTLPAR
ncbi:MAG: tRNA (adenosine(37)-N6)-threonylcarbamoyltransferase complex transferase subunit TsaD [Kiritimatiellia bacterium]